MAYRINHIHIKSQDPRAAAEWYELAFGFKILSDETRVFGDRFLRCSSGEGGILVSISNARTNETLKPADPSARYGLEHFCVESDNLEADIERLVKLGAKLQEAPVASPTGVRFAFIEAPDKSRIELLQLPKK